MAGKRTERLGMRVRANDKEEWKKAAAKSKVSLSSWIEEKLNKAALDESK
jgi:predicted HicB family RNase H-like nuclease